LPPFSAAFHLDAAARSGCAGTAPRRAELREPARDGETVTVGHAHRQTDGPASPLTRASFGGHASVHLQAQRRAAGSVEAEVLELLAVDAALVLRVRGDQACTAARWRARAKGEKSSNRISAGLRRVGIRHVEKGAGWGRSRTGIARHGATAFEAAARPRAGRRGPEDRAAVGQHRSRDDLRPHRIA
jgi:hypothetical protein